MNREEFHNIIRGRNFILKKGKSFATITKASAASVVIASGKNNFEMRFKTSTFNEKFTNPVGGFVQI